MPDISKLSGTLIDSVGKVDGVLKESIASIAGITFPQGSFLLDDYPGSAVAYSVRKLSSTYSGSALRVRRTVSPFDEQDIGFDSNGDLDTAAIATFGGSDPLTVSAWYDQSGQSKHATQATAASQPTIYDGAAVITENGKPTLKFDGLDKLDTNYSPQLGTASTADFYAASVATQSAATTGHIWRATGGAVIFGRFESSRQPRIFARDSNGQTAVATGTAVTLNTQILQGGLLSNGSISNYINGSIDGTGSATYTGNFNLTANIFIGSAGSIEYLTGNVQEFVFYPSDETSNRSGIETNINNYFGIY